MTGAIGVGARLVAILALLAACQPSGPGGDAASPLAVPAISVTALDAAPPVSGDEEAQASRAAAAQGGADASSVVSQQAQADEAPAHEAAAAVPARPGPPAPSDEPPAPAPSAAQVACERGRGVWTQGETGGAACVHYTRDSGKECRRSGDCEGECLARSGTCAPLRPLLGCNDILDDMGRPMRQCLN